MTDYIDREDVIEWIDYASDGCSYLETGVDFAKRDINAIPAADVVEVVRCKDCRYSIREDEYELWCNGFCNPARLVRDADYCSHGAAKA